MENKQLGFREERKDVDARKQFIKEHPHPISLILDGISNQRNLASIFRIAEAARVKKVYGYKIPLFEQDIKLRRISRGTFEMVDFQLVNSIEKLKSKIENTELVALEITNTSIPYTEYIPQKECCLIIGGEKNGVSKELLSLTSTSIHIPMHGLNTSMNVSVATGIATFEILRKIL